jgi:hypothetical protein
MKKRTRILGTVAVLAVLAAAVLSEMHHQPSTLLQRAHKIVPLGTWDAVSDNYFWLSNQEALLVMQTKGLGTQVKAQRVNCLLGTVIEDTALEAVIGDHMGIGVSGWYLSPNGQWLLSQKDGSSWTATNLINSRQIRWSNPMSGYGGSDNLVAWSPDSRFWVQAVQEEYMTHTYLYPINSPHVSDHPGNFGLDGLQVIGFFGPTRLLTLLPRTGDGGGISMADYDVVTPTTSSHFYMQHIPPNMDVQKVILSPDESRLAWKFTVKPLPLGLASTINSSYVRRSAPTVAGLWVSDLNCNHLREIGTLDIRDDHLTNLRWTPDSKKLSFINDNIFYTVPAD